MPSLEERLSTVEAQLASLGEGGQESFITVGPTGLITYDFAGHISADGIGLPLGDAGILSSDDSRIRWLPQPSHDPDQLAEILAAGGAGGATTFLLRIVDDAGTDHYITLFSSLATGELRSDFLRKASGIHLEHSIDYGVGSVTGNGTNLKADGVNHALGRIPEIAGAFPSDSSKICATDASSLAANSVSFNFRDRTSGTNWSNTFDYYWFVIG